MKRTMLLISVLILITSCSTSPISRYANMQRDAMEEMVKEDKVIGDDLPSWIYKSGIENGLVYVTGAAEFSADRSPLYVQQAALMNAETKLLSEAPADFRVLTQNAMTGAGIDSAEFYQIQTKLQEVIGLTGVKHDAERIICRKMLRYGELSTRVTRVCYARVYASIRELTKAYERTLAYKFGHPTAERFQKIMSKELEKINSNPLTRRQEISSEKDNLYNSSSNIKPNFVKPVSNIVKPSIRNRMPTKQFKESSSKSKSLQHSNIKRRDLSRSSHEVKYRNTKGRIPTTSKAGRRSYINR